MLERTLTPDQIKFKLVNLLDELMLINNQPAWNELVTPELEKLHSEAVDALDGVWWNYRSILGSSEE